MAYLATATMNLMGLTRFGSILEPNQYSYFESARLCCRSTLITDDELASLTVSTRVQRTSRMLKRNSEIYPKLGKDASSGIRIDVFRRINR
jgi:hypothetical protein